MSDFGTQLVTHRTDWSCNQWLGIKLGRLICWGGGVGVGVGGVKGGENVPSMDKCVLLTRHFKHMKLPKQFMIYIFLQSSTFPK